MILSQSQKSSLFACCLGYLQTWGYWWGDETHHEGHGRWYKKLYILLHKYSSPALQVWTTYQEWKGVVKPPFTKIKFPKKPKRSKPMLVIQQLNNRFVTPVTNDSFRWNRHFPVKTEKKHLKLIWKSLKLINRYWFKYTLDADPPHLMEWLWRYSSRPSQRNHNVGWKNGQILVKRKIRCITIAANNVLFL